MTDFEELWHESEDCVPIYEVKVDRKNRRQRRAMRRDVVEVPRAAVHVVNGPVGARLPVRKTAEEIKAEFDALSLEERDAKFWELIAELHWQHHSNGIMYGAHIVAKFRNWSDLNKKIFSEIYTSKYIETKNKLNVFLTEMNQFQPGDIDKIVSHTIALGKDVWNNLTNDIEILTYLVQTNECQNLHDMVTGYFD